MSRHIDRRLGSNRVFAPPQTGHRLLLGVELKSGLAIESVRTAASNRLLVTSEGEHGELLFISFVHACFELSETYRDGNGHIDTNLTSLNLTLEATGSGT